jgi:protein phosphatase
LKAASPPPPRQFTNGRLAIEVVGATDVGLHRDHNEDALGILPDTYEPAAAERGYLFAVADGMGGAEKGEVASQLAVDTLFSAYYGAAPSIAPPERLRQALVTANDAVHHEGQTLEFGMMGTTLVACLVLDNSVIVTNVGDSRAYLLRGGALRQLSEDHSLVAEQVRAGVLTPDQARRSAQRNIITRAVGHQPNVEVDLFQLAPVLPGDVLLLCSDGLHGLVEDAELLRIGVRSADIGQAAANLIAAANNRGGHDNITCLLVRIVATGPGGVDSPTVKTRAVSSRVHETQPGLRPPPLNQPTNLRPARLLAFAGLLAAVVAVGGVVFLSSGRDSSLASTAVSSAPTAAPGPPSFSGRVDLPPRLASAPAGNAVVVAVGPSGRRLNTPVERDGRYSLKLPADAPVGEYTLSLLPERIAVEAGVVLCGSTTAGGQFAVYPPQRVRLAPGAADLEVNLPCTIDEGTDASGLPPAAPTGFDGAPAADDDALSGGIDEVSRSGSAAAGARRPPIASRDVVT